MNFISRLENAWGEWVEGEHQIGELIVGHYFSLFSIANPISF